MSERMSQVMQERTPKIMSKNMPERMPEDKDRMQERMSTKHAREIRQKQCLQIRQIERRKICKRNAR